MSSSWPYRTFGLLSALSVLIWWNALLTTFRLASTKDVCTHILLILPISVTLVLLERKRQEWKPKPAVGGGLVLLLLAVGIGVGGHGLASSGRRVSIEMLALVLWWLGSFVACFGGRIFRNCAFPLLFLVWLVPIPEFVLNHVVEFLRQGTAAFARILFTTVGVPVTQDGTALTIPGLTVEVAQECSSIRSSIMLLVSSMVVSYVLLRSFWGRAGVVLATIPLAIGKNAVRVFTLAMLGTYVDRGFLTGRLHHQGGVLFFAASLAGLLFLICVFGWAEGKAPSRYQTSESKALGGRELRIRTETGLVAGR